MNVFIAIVEACKESYVQSCNPAPKTPSSEIVPKMVTDTLAVTGGEANIAGIVIAGCFVVAGALLFLYNHLMRKERRGRAERAQQPVANRFEPGIHASSEIPKPPGDKR